MRAFSFLCSLGIQMGMIEFSPGRQESRLAPESSLTFEKVHRSIINPRPSTPALPDTAQDEAQNLTKGQILQKAGMLLIAGTTLVALFSDPMVDAVASFSTATHIPPFFVSFLVIQCPEPYTLAPYSHFRPSLSLSW